MKFVKKSVSTLTAAMLVAISGFSSVCMAAREFDYISEFNRQSKLICEYSLNMLKSVNKSIGLIKGGTDGNYFKRGELNDEEKVVYSKIVAKVDEIKEAVGEDNCSLPEDYKLAKAIFLWVRKNIKYDEGSVSLPADSDTIEDKLGVEKNRENRKAQDALTVFSNREGVCEGISKLAQLMMKIAGLSCVGLSNHIHGFNAVWLGENPGGWAVFDATATEDLKQDEQKDFNSNEKIRLKYNNSLDNMILNENFPATYKYGSATLEEINKCFISETFMDHYIYAVFDDSADFYSCFTNCNGVRYALAPITLIVEVDDNLKTNNSIFVDEKMLRYKSRCMIYGNIKNIENFDVFYRNFVRVDVSKSYIEQTLERDGIEFKLFSDGKRSNLAVKPLNGSVSCDTVTIPNELIPFLPDIDKFDVDSNIKTVKYDLLWKENTLKEKAVSNGVKFEQINFIK